MFFAMCHKVKFIEATKHFRPLFEDDASRKRKLPTSHSCPADLAVSDPELPLRTETKTRMQTEASSSSHGKSDTPATEKSKLELELEDAVENGFELRKGLGLRFQRAHAPNTAKHAEYKALKSHQQKAQFRRDWAIKSFTTCRKKPLPKLPRRGQGVGRVRVFRCDGQSATRWAVHGCRGMPRSTKKNTSTCDGNTKRSSQKNGLCSRQNPKIVSFSMKTQQTVENATPAKNKSKAKATYTQCFPQHTRVLHMHVAVLHGPRVCLCRFWVDPKPRQSPRSLQRSKETATGQLA